MKEKFFCYTVDADMGGVECDLYDATLIVRSCPDGKLRAEIPCARNIHAANNDGALYISQTKRRLFKTCGQVITLYVPEHIVPALKLSGENYKLQIEGGMYGDLTLNAESAVIEPTDCTVAGVEIICGKIQADFSDATIKGNLFIQAKEGDVLAENTFASLCEIHLRSGNIGLSLFTCKEGTLDTGAGNVTATIDAARSDYSLSAVAKEGTVNCETDPELVKEKTLKAYSEKGNIVIEFLHNEESVEEI